MPRYTIKCFSGSEVTKKCENCHTFRSGRFLGNGLKIEDTELELEYRVLSPVTMTTRENWIELKGSQQSAKSFNIDDTDFTIKELEDFISDCNCNCGDSPTEPSEDNPHLEITDVNLQTAGSPTLIDVKSFADTNDYRSVFIYYIGTGSGNNQFADADYVYHVDKDGHVLTVEKPAQVVGGGKFKIYTQNGTTWVADGTGVQIERGTGFFRIIIPDNVLVASFEFLVIPTQINANDSFQIIYDHSADNANNPTYNLDEDTMLRPDFSKWIENSRQGNGLDSAPFTKDVDSDPQPQIVSVAGGVATWRIINANGIPFMGVKASLF